MIVIHSKHTCMYLINCVGMVIYVDSIQVLKHLIFLIALPLLKDYHRIVFAIYIMASNLLRHVFCF